jgi:curved DNA-binding protein CbpA
MIDYFALLDEPRAPWLEADKLKETYHRKTLQTHPDVHARSPGAASADTTFASLNEAYQILQDPRRRLPTRRSRCNCRICFRELAS